MVKCLKESCYRCCCKFSKSCYKSCGYFCKIVNVIKKINVKPGIGVVRVVTKVIDCNDVIKSRAFIVGITICVNFFVNVAINILIKVATKVVARKNLIRAAFQAAVIAAVNAVI